MYWPCVVYRPQADRTCELPRWSWELLAEVPDHDKELMPRTLNIRNGGTWENVLYVSAPLYAPSILPNIGYSWDGRCDVDGVGVLSSAESSYRWPLLNMEVCDGGKGTVTWPKLFDDGPEGVWGIPRIAGSINAKLLLFCIWVI